MINPDPAFVDKFYQEAISLLVESRAYISGQALNDMNSIDPSYSLNISKEITRVTSRLTEIIAWILTYRAAGGKKHLHIYKPSPHLSRDSLCMEDSVRNSPHPLPLQLIHLLDETLRLYQRLLRLEEDQE